MPAGWSRRSISTRHSQVSGAGSCMLRADASAPRLSCRRFTEGHVSDTRSSGFMLGDLRTFGDILRRNAQSNGGDVGALCVASGRSLTWSDLNARANSFANAAAGLGVRNGDRIALLSENLHQYAEVLYG